MTAENIGYGGRDSHSRAEARHTFEHTTETPCEQQHEQTLVGGHLDELRLDGLYLLRLAKDVIAEDSTDNNQDNGETSLEEALDHRPDGDAIDRRAGVLFWQDAHGRYGK